MHHIEATETLLDSPTMQLAAAYQWNEELKGDLQIEKRHSAKWEREFDKWQLKSEATDQSSTSQLQLDKDMLLHQFKSLSSQKSCLESELRVFEHVIQWPTTNKVHATQGSNYYYQTPAPTGICGPSEPISSLCGCRAFLGMSSYLPISGGK